MGKFYLFRVFGGFSTPFFKGLNFETISTIYEGNNGFFLRYNYFITPTLFIFEENSFKNVSAIFQLQNRIGKFTNGLYMHFKEKEGFGFFTGYFSNYTFKISLLKEENDLKFNALLEKRIKSLILDFNFYGSRKGEILPLPGFYLNSKFVSSLEVRFPGRIFEIPYILVIYDYTNRIPLILLDYKYILGNHITLEIGGISYTRKRKGYFSVYAGIKFIRVF